jgi:hypothetical protein
MSKKINVTDENNALVAFKPAQGVTEYQVILDKGADTIWATELQVANIFGRERTVVNRHIKNAYKDGELNEEATSAKIALVRTEGDRENLNPVLLLNDDKNKREEQVHLA